MCNGWYVQHAEPAHLDGAVLGAAELDEPPDPLNALDEEDPVPPSEEEEDRPPPPDDREGVLPPDLLLVHAAVLSRLLVTLAA